MQEFQRNLPGFRGPKSCSKEWRDRTLYVLDSVHIETCTKTTLNNPSIASKVRGAKDCIPSATHFFVAGNHTWADTSGFQAVPCRVARDSTEALKTLADSSKERMTRNDAWDTGCAKLFGHRRSFDCQVAVALILFFKAAWPLQLQGTCHSMWTSRLTALGEGKGASNSHCETLDVSHFICSQISSHLSCKEINVYHLGDKSKKPTCHKYRAGGETYSMGNWCGSICLFYWESCRLRKSWTESSTRLHYIFSLLTIRSWIEQHDMEMSSKTFCIWRQGNLSLTLILSAHLGRKNTFSVRSAGFISQHFITIQRSAQKSWPEEMTLGWVPLVQGISSSWGSQLSNSLEIIFDVCMLKQPIHLRHGTRRCLSRSPGPESLSSCSDVFLAEGQHSNSFGRILLSKPRQLEMTIST